MNKTVTENRGAAGASYDSGLTEEVAQFVHGTHLSDLGDVVVENGKKSILDGIGLALSGSVAASGEMCRRQMADIGAPSGSATVIGSDMKVPPRFCRFHAMAVGITCG